MKRIFLDINFVVDYLLREEYKHDAQKFLEVAAKRGCEFYISYLTIANFAYIARKLDKVTLYQHLKKLCLLFNIVKNDNLQIFTAIKINASDFEDALQYAAAMDADCDCIITRNSKDFEFSEIPILKATECTEKYL